MDSTRTRRLTAGAVVVTLVAGLMALVVMQPASAGHGSRSLEVTPEVRTRPLSTDGVNPNKVTLTARLGPSVPPAALSNSVVIAFELEGGPADSDGVTPSTPDATCTIAATANAADPTECTVDVSPTAANVVTNVGGTTFVRAWVDEDKTAGAAGGGTEADRTEGRLSSEATDCATETDPEDFEACQAGTPAPGTAAEPDDTDVVEVTFTRTNAALRLDCSELTLAPTGETASIPCKVTDEDGFARSGVKLDAEILSGANNPDPGSGGTTADSNDSCTSSEADGSCDVKISGTPGEIDFATVCIWADSDTDSGVTPVSYNPDGDEADGGLCAGNDAEPLSPDVTSNQTDVVRVKWEDRARASLDVAPDIPGSSTVGASHTLTATALDQFGAEWTGSNTAISGEFFSGSPKDTDDNTPATPDLGTCNTNSGEGDEDTARCTFTYTSAAAPGTDVMCFWFGTAPVMTGSGTAGATCTSDGTGEKLVGGTDAPRVDVVSKSWSAAPPPNNTNNTNTTTVATSDQGYTLVGSDGGIFTYGTSKFHGSTGDLKLNEPVIGMANKKGGTGYWLVAKDGGIFSFGDAEFFGSTGDIKLNAPILGMEATPSGRGYFLFAEDGGIFTFGDAVFRGSTGDRKLNKPAVGMAVNENGDGYWLVAQDGGIFSFGRVPFHGSTGDRVLNEPVFDMAPTAGDNGYWLVAKDGGVFSFGDAEGKFYGSAVGKTTAPVIGMGATPSFNGYWIADAQGAVFHFGDALFLGDRRNQAENAATVGFATVPKK